MLTTRGGATLATSIRVDDSPSARVGADDVGGQLLAEIDLGFPVVGGMDLVFHDVELQLVQRPAHIVEPVLRLDDHLMKASGVRPCFRFFGERPKMPLAPPIAARPSDPAV